MGLLSVVTETGEGHQTDADPIPSHQTLAGRINLGQLLYLAQAGELSISTGVLKFVADVDMLIVSVFPSLGTAAGSGDTIWDIHRFNSSDVDQGSMWPTTSLRPTVAGGSTRDSPVGTAPESNAQLSAGEYFLVHIDAVGSGPAPVDGALGLRVVLG